MNTSSASASTTQAPPSDWAASTRRGSILPRLVGSIALTSEEADELHELLRRRPSFIPPSRHSPNIFNEFAASTVQSEKTTAQDAEANLEQLIDDLLNSRCYFTLANLEAKEATARNELMKQFIAVVAEIRDGFFLNIKSKKSGSVATSIDSVGTSRRTNQQQQQSGTVSAIPAPRRSVLAKKGAAYLVREIHTMTDLINTERFQLSETGSRYLEYEDALIAALQLIVKMARNVSTSAAKTAQKHDKQRRADDEPNSAELEEGVARAQLDAQEGQERGGLRLMMKMASPVAMKAHEMEAKRRAAEESGDDDEKEDKKNRDDKSLSNDDAAALKIQSAQRQRAARQELDRLKQEKNSTANDQQQQQREPTTVEREEEVRRAEVDAEESQARGGLRLVFKMAVKQPEQYQQRHQRADEDGKSSDDDENDEHQQPVATASPARAPPSTSGSTLSEDAAALKIQSAQRQRIARQELDRRRRNKKTASSVPAAPVEQHEEVDPADVELTRHGSTVGKPIPRPSHDQKTTHVVKEEVEEKKKHQHDDDENNSKNKPKELDHKTQGRAPTEQFEENVAAVSMVDDEITPEQAAAIHQQKDAAALKIQSAQRQRAARGELTNLKNQNVQNDENKTKGQEDAEYQAMLKQEEKQETTAAAAHHHHHSPSPSAAVLHNQIQQQQQQDKVLSYEEIQVLATEHVRKLEEERRHKEEQEAAEKKKNEERQEQQKREEEEKQLRIDAERKAQRQREAEAQLRQLEREDREVRANNKSSREIATIPSSDEHAAISPVKTDAEEREERRRFVEYQQEKKRQQEEEDRQRAEQERIKYEKHAKLDALDFDPFAEIHEEKRKRKLALAEQKKQEEEEKRRKSHHQQQQQKSRAITLVPSPPRQSQQQQQRDEQDEDDYDDEQQTNGRIEPRQLSSALSPRPNRVLRRDRIMPKNDPKSAASVLARIFEREVAPVVANTAARISSSKNDLDNNNYEEVKFDDSENNNNQRNSSNSPIRRPPHQQQQNNSNRLKHLPSPPSDDRQNNENPRNVAATESTSTLARSCFDVSPAERERLLKIRQQQEQKMYQL